MFQTHFASHIFFSQDGRWFIHVLPGDVRIHDFDKRTFLREISGIHLGISPSEPILLTSVKNKQLHAWNVLTGDELDLQTIDRGSFPRHQRVFFEAGARSLTILDAFGREEPQELPFIEQVEEFAGIIRAPDTPFASIIVGWDIAGQEGSLGICIDVDNGKRIQGWYSVESCVRRRLSFSTQQNTLTITNLYDSIVVIDLLTGKQIGKLRTSGTYAAHNPVDRSIIAVADSSRILLLQITTGQVVNEIEIGCQVDEVAFHPSGQQIACLCGIDKTSFWDLQTGIALWHSNLENGSKGGGQPGE